MLNIKLNEEQISKIKIISKEYSELRKRYHDLIKDIKKELNVRDVFNNKKAGEAFQKAKQTIQRQEVETFHDSSIMARNILGSQIILVIYPAIYVGPLSKKLGIMLVLLVILSLYWYHKNCIYVKYVLSEYYKTINKKTN